MQLYIICHIYTKYIYDHILVFLGCNYSRSKEKLYKTTSSLGSNMLSSIGTLNVKIGVFLNYHGALFISVGNGLM